jgi:hyperosmotically inducible protein
MKSSLKWLGAVALLSAVSTGALAQQPKPADNTAINARDKSGDTTTPVDQSNAKADIQLAADVRSAIVKDKQLSTKAHNVKLVAMNGVVVLRGPVANDAEKARVADIVTAVNGVSRVDNQLDIAH